MEIFHQQQTNGQPSIDCLSGWSISPFKKAIQELNPLGPLGHHLPVGFYSVQRSHHAIVLSTKLDIPIWLEPCGWFKNHVGTPKKKSKDVRPNVSIETIETREKHGIPR
jgi:hypothetical protein